MIEDKRIDLNNLPKHIAIIMDGNGRWAKNKGEHRIFGHQHGVKSVRECTEAAAELGIKYLTLYAFSTENWSRPKEEVDALMELLVQTILAETPTLNKNNIRLKAIGNLKSLPGKCFEQLQEAMAETEKNTGLTLVLALSYSSKWEIVDAVKQIATEVANGKLSIQNIDNDTFSNFLTTFEIPDPELLIRTSGEHRISNFLLWQIAYAELYFTETLWPDFNRLAFFEAIVDYQTRERRFGKTSEQLIS
ncbi:MAG TPA: isoprenyl transferase [Bacteroidia bacterium]|nr:isoprenyl transferase [Bacteroidia bacterium]